MSIRRVIDFFSGARTTWIIVIAMLVGFCIGSPALALANDSAHVWWNLLSYPFVHTEAYHLAVNVVAMLLVGSWFERRLGSVSILAVFVAGCVFGAISFLVFSWAVPYVVWLEGASAGIIAVAVCVIAACRPVFFIGPIHFSGRRAIFILLGVFAVGIFGPNPGGALAHIGGWLAGWFSAAVIMKLTRSKNQSEAIVVERARVSGYTSLTDAERLNLFNGDTNS